jgi:hypothetical protein
METTRRTLRTILVATAVACCAGGVGVALAAGAPTATTTAATNVGSASATLNGSVAPNQNETTYYFEYGSSTAYGTKTAVQGPLNGKNDKKVSADLSGLAPSTTYHFRLVATNPAGTSNGADMTFTTLAAGATPGLTIAAAPKTVTYSRPVAITGQLTGPGNAGVTVTLEQNPAPYTGAFASTGVTAVTSATGAYSMAVTPALNTHYRVVTKGKGKDQTTSAEIAVRVRLKVAFHLSDPTPKSGQKVRFYGTVLPGHDGKVARIQRRTSTGKWRTVASATLVAATPLNGVARSKFAKRLAVRKSGIYRVRVAPGDGDHVAGTSARRRATVG